MNSQWLEDFRMLTEKVLCSEKLNMLRDVKLNGSFGWAQKFS